MKTQQADTTTQAQFKTAEILCPEVLAHAQRLADALEKTLDVITGDQAAELGVYEALAQWEGEKQ